MRISILASGGLIGVLFISSIALLYWVNSNTKEQIEDSYTRSMQAPLFDILDQAFQTDAIQIEPYPIPEKFWSLLGFKSQHHLNIVNHKNEPVALIIPATTYDGYSGKINIIVAVKRDGHIIGVRTITHSETPGLGDKIDLSNGNWIMIFDGKSISNTPRKLWTISKEGGKFDQISGATITSKAVIRKVFQALSYFEQDKSRVLNAAPSETDDL